MSPEELKVIGAAISSVQNSVDQLIEFLLEKNKHEVASLNRLNAEASELRSMAAKRGSERLKTTAALRKLES